MVVHYAVTEAFQLLSVFAQRNWNFQCTTEVQSNCFLIKSKWN